MELTQTGVVFSRITMVLFMCRNKHSRNDLKLHGATFGKYKKYLQNMKARGPTTCPRGWGRACPPRARPLPRGPPGAPPTPTPTLYIVFRGEKNEREEFITFYDTEPPPTLKPLGRADLESVRGSGVTSLVLLCTRLDPHVSIMF